MKTSLNFFLVATVIALCFSTCQKPSGGIFTVISEKVDIDQQKEPAAIAAINVKIDMQMIHSDSNSVIILPLPDKSTLRLIRKRLDVFENGRLGWYGVIDKDPGSFALISITENAIVGHITTSKGKIYLITYSGIDLHRIAEIDSKKFKETPDDFIIPEIKEQEFLMAGDCPDPPTSIDVMVVYTADAETGAGGHDGMVALIYECIYLSNLAYQNSNVNQRLNLVHLEKVTYTETGNGETDLERLKETSDGYMDNVHALRNTYSADMVALIVEKMTGGAYGIGYLIYNFSGNISPYAFSVITRTNAVSSLTFPHELGHNMGGRHDCSSDATVGSPYDYNHGHFVSNPSDGGPSWRTVMSYNNCITPPCQRIPFFSNPNLTYSHNGSPDTDPLGTNASAGNCTSNNAKVLNNTAGIISNLRCSSPGVTNVWMKDSWNDSGSEPDPKTAGDDMWKSPYIWIRNTQDPNFLHQFEHENPIYGQDNWIYLKMINGGPSSASGNLEVYYANASVSLTWLAGWTMIRSEPVTIDANSNKVVPILWNNLPGTGHYCLVARWNSLSDPMHTTETTDIDYNVRQNNNIIWRNVNIIQLGPDMDKDIAEFEMKNKGGDITSIQFSDEALFPKHAFIESGEIYIMLDDIIYQQWKKGGSKGTGIKILGDRIQLTEPVGTLENIMLGRSDSGKVTIQFVRNNQTIPDRYFFNVKQIVPVLDREKKQTTMMSIGGVTYEIYTYKR